MLMNYLVYGVEVGWLNFSWVTKLWNLIQEMGDLNVFLPCELSLAVGGGSSCIQGALYLTQKKKKGSL